MPRKDLKRCCICDDYQNEEGSEPIGHCRHCGRPVCDFCAHLRVCCDMEDDD